MVWVFVWTKEKRNQNFVSEDAIVYIYIHIKSCSITQSKMVKVVKTFILQLEVNIFSRNFYTAFKPLYFVIFNQ